MQTDTSAISLVRFCGVLLFLQLRSEVGRISPNDFHAESMRGLHQILVSLQILFHKDMQLHSAKSLRTFWTFQVFPEAGIPFLRVFVPLSYFWRLTRHLSRTKSPLFLFRYDRNLFGRDETQYSTFLCDIRPKLRLVKYLLK